ncbi:MAG: DEAD/DEAH box helicase [Desulfatiglandales bacterium]
MIILHAAWHHETLHLWGEMSPKSPYTPSPLRGRRPKVIKAVPSPYDAGLKGLVEALSSFQSGLKVTKRQTGILSVWLPSKGNVPLPSSPLIDNPPSARGRLALLPWTVTVRALTFEEARDFLCASRGKDLLARGVMPGADLAWWGESLSFAGSLVTRQSYLPGVAPEGEDYVARWEPVLEGLEGDRFNALAEGMPPSARCATDQDATVPPQISARQITGAFVSMAVDRLVRGAASIPGRRPSRRRKRPAFESIHDAWLHALKTPDAPIAWDDGPQLEVLSRQVREWQRPARVLSQAPFRLCFRLEEPENGGAGSSGLQNGPDQDRWQVRYLLQPREDRSLLVRVEEVWDARTPAASMLSRYGTGAQEYLLAALGQAAGLCPGVAGSLEAPHPGGFETDTTGAHEFLILEAGALESAGFGIILPAWWTPQGTKSRLSVSAHVKSPLLQARSGLSLATLVRFNWEVALGGKKVSFKELETLAEMKAPLVRFRGQWVELDGDQIRAALDFWKRRETGETSLREILHMALGARDEMEGLPFEGVQATGWVGQFLKQLEGEAHFEEMSAPKDFSGLLRPYQVRGYSWLSFLKQWGLGACLADDMGLGKTIQILALVARERERGETRPVLIICPTSVVNNWRKEAERFTPHLDVLVHHGLGRQKRTTFRNTARSRALIISSYGLLHRDLETLKEVDWAGVVLDEAQNIKNPETKQSRAARALTADFRTALTGTPVENHVGDLWAIMDFLNPGLLGSQGAFKEHFFRPIQVYRDEETANRLKRMTGPFVLRRLKTDASIISDLPEKMEIKTFCSLTKEQASLYAAVTRDALEQLEEAEGMQRRGIVLSILTRLKQVCNHPSQFLGDGSAVNGRSGKVTRLEEMLEEVLENGERALIFTQFARMGEILKGHLQETFGREALFLHGGVTKKKRDLMVDRFQQEKDAPPFFILSLKAGGTGLNLTRANHVFHFDRWWNPAVENQATDRAFRIGQTRNVQVHKFVCSGTLEERIDEMIENKTAIADQVVGTGEGWLTELSNDDLKTIFALGKDALGE